jgi:hypothetical protein
MPRELGLIHPRGGGAALDGDPVEGRERVEGAMMTGVAERVPNRYLVTSTRSFTALMALIRLSKRLMISGSS